MSDRKKLQYSYLNILSVYVVICMMFIELRSEVIVARFVNIGGIVYIQRFKEEFEESGNCGS